MKLVRIIVVLIVCFQAEACEILVKAIDHSNGDAAEDRMCYKQGYPVEIRPDGYTWSYGCSLRGGFWVVKIPGLTVDKALSFASVWEEGGTNYTRRLWKFYKADLPAAVQTKLDSVGVITIGAGGDLTWNQARAALRNQKTGAQAPTNP